MLSIPLCAALLLQTGAPPTVRTVTVTVTDRKGTPIQGLAPEEVAVLENGVVRELTRLELDRRPLTVAVLVDSSAPMASVYRLDLVDAVVQFLRRLPEGSRYVLWATGDRPTKVVDLSTDPAEASRALKRVFPTGGNTLLDALVEASQDLRTREGERGVVVVVTGVGIGFANRHRRQVVEQAQGGDTLFMAVQFEEAGSPDVRAEGVDQVARSDYEFVLESLTRSSGGLLERPLSAMGVGVALQRISAALSAQYRLSYAAATDVKDRKIEVRVARPGVRVRVGPASSR